MKRRRISKYIQYKRRVVHQSASKMSKRKFIQNETGLIIVLLLVALFITGFELKLIYSQLLTRDIIRQGIDYDAFRDLRVDEEALQKTEKEMSHLLKLNPNLKNVMFIDEVGYLTFSMMARDYNLIDNYPVDEQTFMRGIGEVAATQSFQELYGYYKAIFSDLECFPVPKIKDADITYADSWYDLRNYGGKRRHEGTDLMASNNLRGNFPIISITDGTVEKIGWLEQGGYRIGIRSESGGYFYYAHLYSYAPELKQGDTVIAGQLLGFMGDSGYGKEGTVGQFDVHLHLGIYVNTTTGEMSINPFSIMQILEKHRTEYDYQ